MIFERIEQSYLTSYSVCEFDSSTSFSNVYTLSFEGIDPTLITVETSISSGLPAFIIVGLPDKAIAESRERIRSALNFMGISLPPKKITVNMSPANVQKEGSHYDLPIAISLLVAMKIIDFLDIENFIIMGELSLNGKIISVPGVLCAAIKANSLQKGFICPYDSGRNVFYSGNQNILLPQNLLSLINYFKGIESLPTLDTIKFKQNDEFQNSENCQNDDGDNDIDMSDVVSQEVAKKAAEVACAGGHNILFIGPPGCGKSLISQRMQTILPEMTTREMLETAMIYDVYSSDYKVTKKRPFRSPHHSASPVSMVGGGSKPKPGEISLAHNGVLFMDELPEFSRQTLESLRQPMETGKITIARANANTREYMSSFQFVGAMNPCMCGNLGKKQCENGAKCAEMYQKKLSGPLLDRIDIKCYVKEVDIVELLRKRDAMSGGGDIDRDVYDKRGADTSDETRNEIGAEIVDDKGPNARNEIADNINKNKSNSSIETSAIIRQRVTISRQIQLFRQNCINAKLSPSQIKHINIDKVANEMILQKIQSSHAISSMRSYSKMLCVARTIADLRMVSQLLKENSWNDVKNEIDSYNDTVLSYMNAHENKPYDYNKFNELEKRLEEGRINLGDMNLGGMGIGNRENENGEDDGSKVRDDRSQANCNDSQAGYDASKDNSKNTQHTYIKLNINLTKKQKEIIQRILNSSITIADVATAMGYANI